MKKPGNFISNNKTFTKNGNPDKKIKINPNYFSLKYIPYHKILNNLLSYLRLKLSPLLFNEIYKYISSEIKKYLKKNISSNNITNSVSFNRNKTDIINQNNNKYIISDFCFNNNYDLDKNKSLIKTRTKANLKKTIQPLINLSYSRKLKNEFLINRQISSFSNNITNKNTSNNLSNLEDKDLSYIIADHNYTIENINNINKKPKIKKIGNINKTTISKQSKNKLNKLFLSDKYNFNTINTSIHKNEKNKFLMLNKIKKNSNNKNIKIDHPQTLINLSSKLYPNTFKIESKNKNKVKSRENSNLKNIKNINNAVVINNTFFNKYKNNYNFGLIPNAQKKIKFVNIKLKDKEKNGSIRIIKPTQNPEEMLDRIKNSLDDDNLKVMLNFSYENFLSKESERESKEYSIED